MNTSFRLPAVLICSTLAAFAPPAAAAPVKLDRTFGSRGRVNTDLGGDADIFRSMAIQSDGKILVAGALGKGVGTAQTRDFRLVRYLANGLPDTTFNGTGVVSADFGRNTFLSDRVAVQNDGKIIVAVQFSELTGKIGSVLMRYNTGGSLDLTFNGTGKVETTIFDDAASMALQTDGKIVLAWSSDPGHADEDYSDFTAARYNADGTADTSFNGTGKVTIDLSDDDLAQSVVVQNNGKILVAGHTRTAGSELFADLALVRINADGSLDRTFNGTGKVTTDLDGRIDTATSVAVQSDGKILVAGSIREHFDGFEKAFALVRYTANGQLDTSFNGRGIVTTKDFRGRSVAIQSDGKIVAAGNALLRFNPNGTLDKSFNATGIVPADEKYTAQGVVLQTDGRILLGGVRESFRSFDIALVRYLAGSSVGSSVLLASGDPAFGAGSAGGPPADAVLTSFGPPAIDDAGTMAFTSKWTSATAGDGSGLFKGDTLVAKIGGAVPGVPGATFATFFAPVIDSGHVAFIATLAGVPAANSPAVFSDAPTGALALVARAGEVAANADGASFESFRAVAVSGESVAVFARLQTGTGAPAVTEADDAGLWAIDTAHPLIRLLREGQTVGAERIGTLATFMVGDGSPGQGRGWLRTPAGGSPEVLALALLSGNAQAVLSAALDGTVKTLSRSGPDGAGGPDIDEANFASYGVPAANAAGHSAFRASLTVGTGGISGEVASGVFLRAPGESLYTPVTRTGDLFGTTGAKVTALKDPVLASDGGILFPVTVKGGSVHGLAKRTLCWLPPGAALTLLAQGGTEPANVPGARWEAFTSLAIAAESGPIFTASLVLGKGGVTAKNAIGVWAMTSTGALRLLFRTGDIIDGKKMKSFTVLKAVPGSVGLTRSFNDNAQVIWRATFTDLTQAIVTTAIP